MPENKNYNGRRALKNTLLLYLRMFLCMLMGFAATRFLLKNLGAEHFGLASVLGSIVGLFGIVTSPLSVAALRFSAVELGLCREEDSRGVSRMFSLLIEIYFILVSSIIVVGTPLVLWVFFTRVKIAPGDVGVGMAYMLLFTLSLALELLKVPFWAVVIAHENMNFFSCISIVDSLLRLVFFILIGLVPSPLVMYGVVQCAISAFNLLSYIMFMRFRHGNYRFSFWWDWRKAREIILFALYQMGGGISAVIYNSGINILINNYFGSAVNASRGLATQFSSGIGNFAQNFMTAVNPQILKTFSARDYEVSSRLVMRTGKMAFFLSAMAAVPCVLCAPFLCRIWLGEPPQYTVIFIRLVLVQGMIDSFSLPVMTLVSASGRIAIYQAVIGGIMILLLPISYVLLRLGCSPSAVFYAAIVCSAVCLPLRLLLTRRVAPLPVGGFMCKVLFPALVAFAAALLMMSVPMYFYPIKNFLSCLWAGGWWCVFWSACVLFIGMSRDERSYVLGVSASLLNRLRLTKKRA